MNDISLKKNILIIDDDSIFCETVKDEFTINNFNVFTAYTGEDGRKICSKNEIDIILLDQNLPDIKGDKLCSSLLNFNDRCKIIFITAFPSFKNAVNAIKHGAYDYLSKPIELEELHLSIKNILKLNALEKTKQFYNYWSSNEKKTNMIIGNWADNDEIPHLINLASKVNSPVLLTGETGTGKSIIAKSIHYNSYNKDAPFISLNCAALPENLIETELFGYEKGTFTGANSRKKGLFEIADGGTILLDEIGAMPLHLQSKLLGVLDDCQIRRVGGHSSIKVKIRILAATNSKLEEMIKDNTFREDLYYRLSVLQIHIPPLRERLDDISLLCKFFIKKNKHTEEQSLSESEIEKLKKYHWPGNIRELKNIIERSIILQDDELKPSQFIRFKEKENTIQKLNLPELTAKVKTLKEIENNHIIKTLGYFSHNYTKTSKALGISLSTLKRKLKSLKFIKSVQND